MSKTTQKKAAYSINQLLKVSPLSYNTQADYACILKQCIQTLDQSGFHLSHIRQLKPKHIEQLITHWRSLSCATIKNRLSALRYACGVLKKSRVVKSNTDYHIGKRQYVPTQNKAINHLPLEKISDQSLQLSVALQQQFGLRREEALKIKPQQADQGNFLALAGTWTKGGIPRLIPIVTDEQRAILERAKAFCQRGSLIPKNTTYIKQRQRYDRMTQAQGFKNLHGLRHAYAQKRYYQMTKELNGGKGWYTPIQGGKTHREMNHLEKQIDKQAREMISQELGHTRPSITRIYLG